MIEKKNKHAPKKGHLSEEDAEIWLELTRSVKPLSRLSPRELPKGSLQAEKKTMTARGNSVSSKLEGVSKAAKQSHSSSTHLTKETEEKSYSLDLPLFNKHHARKLRKGQLAIEARIDLHGMRQHEAHSALRRFLQSCFAQGKRLVLVITGKGTSSLRSFEDEHGRSTGELQRGVLKRNVPLWLAEPELRPLIVSFTEAAIEHGGSGALYIHLRRASRAER